MGMSLEHIIGRLDGIQAAMAEIEGLWWSCLGDVAPGGCGGTEVLQRQKDRRHYAVRSSRE
jgi:hypothetical protein